MKFSILFILVFSVMSLPAFSADKVSGSDGSSGCGYGWEVTKGGTLSASSTRGSTNSTASNTIAMTMGTSGCDKHGIVKAGKMQEVFAFVNYESILIDMAEGQGEYLTHFASMMGCDAQALGNVAQQNINVMAGSDAASFLQNVESEIAVNPALKQACI